MVHVYVSLMRYLLRERYCYSSSHLSFIYCHLDITSVALSLSYRSISVTICVYSTLTHDLKS